MLVCRFSLRQPSFGTNFVKENYNLIIIFLFHNCRRFVFSKHLQHPTGRPFRHSGFYTAHSNFLCVMRVVVYFMLYHRIWVVFMEFVSLIYVVWCSDIQLSTIFLFSIESICDRYYLIPDW